MVFFDCDGVLMFGNPWLQLHKAMNVSPTQDRRWFGNYYSGKNTFDQWNRQIQDHYKKQKLNKISFEKLLNIKNFEINDEAKSLIDYLKKQKIPTAIISSGIDFYVSEVSNKLDTDFWRANSSFEFDNKNLLKRINYITADSYAKVVAIDGICKILNISPQESIFIGDSGNDIDAFNHTKRGILYKTTNPRNLEYVWGDTNAKLLNATWKKIDNLIQVISIIEKENGS